MSIVHQTEEDVLGLSFVDVLSCGLGAAVFLFLVFSSMPHLGGSNIRGGDADGDGGIDGPPVDMSGAPEAGLISVSIEVWLPDDLPVDVEWPVLQGAQEFAVRSGGVRAERRVLSTPPGEGPLPVLRFVARDGTRRAATGQVRILAAGTIEERVFTLPPQGVAAAGRLLTLDLTRPRCWIQWGPDVQGEECR